MATVDNLRRQLQSARKSILFMETQHASTLKGLHKEIQHLQKKCSELTFALAMNSAEDTEEDKSDQHQVEKVLELETEVSDLMHDKITLMQQVELRDKQLVELEELAKEKERIYLNEIKTKKHKIAAVLQELETRAHTIAYLSSQLQQTNSKLMKFQKQSQVPAFSPSPPVQPRPPSGRRQHQHSKSVEPSVRPASSDGQSLHHQRETPSRLGFEHRPSSSSSAEHSRRSEQRLRNHKSRFVPSPMPDPAPFLNAGEMVADGGQRSRPSVLPPIRSRLEDSVAEDANGNQLGQGRGVVSGYKPLTERLAVSRGIDREQKTRSHELRDY